MPKYEILARAFLPLFEKLVRGRFFAASTMLRSAEDQVNYNDHYKYNGSRRADRLMAISPFEL
jgi:hypothetical protein